MIISSSVADSIFFFDFIVKFKKDVCEAGENVISIIVILLRLFVYAGSFI